MDARKSCKPAKKVGPLPPASGSIQGAPEPLQVRWQGFRGGLEARNWAPSAESAQPPAQGRHVIGVKVGPRPELRRIRPILGGQRAGSFRPLSTDKETPERRGGASESPLDHFCKESLGPFEIEDASSSQTIQNTQGTGYCQAQGGSETSGLEIVRQNEATPSLGHSDTG